MNVADAIHPPQEALHAFGMGQLDDSASENIYSHLEVCADCRSRVAALPDDGLLEQLRQANGPIGTPPPAELLHPLQRPRGAPSPIDGALPSELANHEQYEILRRLGAGGMGVVYLARNKLMDRREVLKFIGAEMLKRPEARERFLREIRAAAALDHENIVRAHSVLVVGGSLVFAMEHVDGDDLAKVVKTQGPLPVAIACLYAHQVALGLQHAHEKGMVHRDIKPHNLILARDSQKHVVKILDFGLAKATSENAAPTNLTGEGRMLGTPDYMAPEQGLDAAAAEISADIYSLGCTLYDLLTGKPPFRASSLTGLLLAHQTHHAEALNLVRSEVPAELAALVAKMMAKDPAQRHQEPLDVAEALLPFLAITRENRRADAEAAASSTRQPFRSRLPAFRVATAVAACVFGLLAYWTAQFVLRVSTNDGVIVVEVNEPNADVYLDGEKITVAWREGGRKAEVRAKPGTRKISVTKEGFTVDGAELTISDRGRTMFSARIDVSRPPLIVSQDGTERFASVQDAVRNAPRGSRVLVRTGHYRETVVVRHQLEIAADGGSDKVLIEGPHDAALKLSGDGITIKGISFDTATPKEKGKSAIEITAGKNVTLSDCDIRSHSERGVLIQGQDTSAVLKSCAIHDCSVDGVLLRAGAKATFEECEFVKNGSAGAEIESRAVFRRCLIQKNGTGVTSQFASGDALLEECTLTENICGVLSCNGGTVSMLRCKSFGNSANGIWAFNQSTVNATDCDLYDNTQYGIAIFKVNASLQKCRINRNKLGGVLVNEGSRCKIEECDLHDNQRGPVSVDAASSCDAQNNKPLVASVASKFKPAKPAALIPPLADRKPQVQGGVWRLQADALVQTNKTAPQAFLQFGNREWRDLDFCFDLQRATEGGTLGALFRTTGLGHTYFLAFGAKGHFIDTAVKFKLIGRPGKSDFVPEKDCWHAVKLQLRGSRATVFIDGNKQYDAKIPHHSGGRLALYTKNVAARFRNLRVTAPDGAALWEGLPDLGQGGVAVGPDPRKDEIPD